MSIICLPVFHYNLVTTIIFAIVLSLLAKPLFRMDLSRMKERCSTDVHILIDNCIREVCDKSRNTLNGKSITTNYHALELWTFAARWAELEYRKDKE